MSRPGYLGSTGRSHCLSWSFVALTLGLAFQATAHDYSPRPIVIEGIGNSVTLTVADCCGCSAEITAASTRPDLFSVTPESGTGVSVQFTVTSNGYGNGVPVGILLVLVKGIGTNPEGEECNEDSVNHVLVTVKHPPSSGGNSVNSTTGGDPVGTFGGDFFWDPAPDLHLGGGPLPLAFYRRYSSHLFRENGVAGVLGPNWRHNFEVKLTDRRSAIEVELHEGTIAEFEPDNGGWALVGDQAVPFELRAEGGGFVFLDPRTSQVYTFNSAGVLQSIADQNGNTLSLSYVNNLLATVSDGLGRTLTFAYNGDERLTSVTDGQRTVTFAHAADRLLSVTDALNNVTTYSYDVSMPEFGPLLTSYTLPEGNVPFTQVYDADGRVVTQTDALNNTHSFSYEAGLTTLTDPMGNVRQHFYDAAGNLTAYVDEAAAMITPVYDGSDRMEQTADTSGAELGRPADPNSGNPSQVTLRDGTTAAIDYAPRNFAGFQVYDVVQITHEGGDTQLYEHDANGNRTGYTDREGSTHSWTYNARGQLLTYTNPSGGVYTNTYNADGTLATSQDAAGNVTSYSYDALLRLSQTTFADGSTRLFEYDALDRLTKVTDELMQETSFVYDDNGNLTASTNALNATTSYRYDALDRLVEVEAPNGSSGTIEYDPLGREGVITDRNGVTTTFTYDSRGNLTGITDGAGNTRSSEYNAEGSLVAETDALGNSRSYERDINQLVTALEYPRGGRITFGYDARGIATTTSDDAGRSTDLTYDGRGLLTEVVSGGTLGTARARNSTGLTTTLTDPNGQNWVSAYDSGGRLTSRTDPLGNVTTFAYDVRNRVETMTFPGGLGTLDFDYDAAGRVTGKTYSDGRTITFQYDDAGRLTGDMASFQLAYNSQDEIVASNGIALTRDAGGRIETITYAPGKAVSYAYDARNLVSSVTDWLGGVTTFGYDAAGRVVSVQRPNGVDTTLTYNADGQVSTINEQAGESTLSSIELFRNLAGFVTAAERDVPLDAMSTPGTVNHTYDAASQTNGFTYDAMGRLGSDGTRTYEWNLNSELTGYTEGSTDVDFTYDAFGALLTRTQSGETTSYVWNYALRLESIAIERLNGTDTRYYIHTPDGALLYAVDAASDARHYYHFDENGNTLFMTDDAAQVTNTYAYSPYGEILAANASQPNPFTYAGLIGHVIEAGTPLRYMRARWYDAANGRFLSRDPRNLSISPLETNPYSYARANPFLFSDPNGTNARVNGGDAHTDISVDVWEGDQIIGVFTLSFSAEAWTNNGGGIGGCLSGVGNFVLALTPVGTSAQLDGGFRLGETVGPYSSSGKRVVPGDRMQDERLGREFLKAIGQDTGLPTVAEELRRIMSNPPKGFKSTSKLIAISVSAEYGRYRLFSQVCNDFTDDMLDVYFGENWYLGPIYTGDGLLEELNEYLAPPPTPTEEYLSAGGIAPVGGSTYVR